MNKSNRDLLLYFYLNKEVIYMLQYRKFVFINGIKEFQRTVCVPTTKKEKLALKCKFNDIHTIYEEEFSFLDFIPSSRISNLADIINGENGIPRNILFIVAYAIINKKWGKYKRLKKYLITPERRRAHRYIYEALLK